MNFLNLHNAEAIEAVPADRAVEYLALSILLGTLLMILAVWSSKKIGNKLGENGIVKSNGRTDKLVNASYSELILGSANVLFLCFGMTGIMILVNNNLARAFAIGAAIAVIRFRIKFDGKGLGATLFFAVLIGMACGVGQAETAILITAAYGILQSLIIFFVALDKSAAKSAVNVVTMSKINSSVEN